MSPLPKKDLNIHGYGYNDALSFIERKNHDAVYCIVSSDCDEEQGDPLFLSMIIHQL